MFEKPSILLFGLILVCFMVVISAMSTISPAYAEEVIFIVPGSSAPGSVVDFDPPFDIINKDEPIVFVNPDRVNHHLIVTSDSDGRQVFDTGIMEPDRYISHAFPDYGE